MGARRGARFMSGERAKRFPLALEDLKRAPRKAEGRAGERAQDGRPS
ncbi:protein-L-isoaspartate O-methyltransferase, partial [Paraburkholderia sp. Se-20369]|nr:protein-L-isoaspartate O-methyltransferase [Paraburkholderia sp. Se-20369]